MTNEGHVTAATVCQLYLDFPAAAGNPSKVLKGFVKTEPLRAGASAVMHFGLGERDLSYHDGRAWVSVPPESIRAFIGLSSAVTPVSFMLPAAPARAA